MISCELTPPFLLAGQRLSEFAVSVARHRDPSLCTDFPSCDFLKDDSPHPTNRQRLSEFAVSVACDILRAYFRCFVSLLAIPPSPDACGRGCPSSRSRWRGRSLSSSRSLPRSSPSRGSSPKPHTLNPQSPQPANPLPSSLYPQSLNLTNSTPKSSTRNLESFLPREFSLIGTPLVVNPPANSKPPPSGSMFLQHLHVTTPAPHVGCEGKRGRWGTPTMALHIWGYEGTMGNSESEGNLIHRIVSGPPTN